MGLTRNSMGANSIESKLIIKKNNKDDKVIALAGNPNVGKSTIFNGLTGMKQHTGNWPGKTVTNAQGYLKSDNQSYVLVDIPGTYSLMAHSKEEEVARNFICFENPDAVVVVCDATALERNLNIVLQTIEMSQKVIVCLNLMDEAKRKKIHINVKKLSEILGVSVVNTIARDKKSLSKLVETLDDTMMKQGTQNSFKVKYADVIEDAILKLEPVIQKNIDKKINTRWLALRLIEGDSSLTDEFNSYIGDDFLHNEDLNSVLGEVKIEIAKQGTQNIKDLIVSSIVKSCEEISNKVVRYESKNYNSFDRKMDKILTSKRFGYPIMLIFLMIIFWITIVGANYPSEILSDFLFSFEGKLVTALKYFSVPDIVIDASVFGVYRVLAWVVSVMLPPMAIFFPLFTLLEDSGYLPRIAYNLDKPFKKCSACGKQSLTMCMGFGCNAAGVVGCRIIDSPRERLLAIITNNFVPCNGRFPTLITIISIFFVGIGGGLLDGLTSSLILTTVILFGIGLTFLVTKILSKTLLKGEPSSFTLELPPFRKPQFRKVIVRSLFDRTAFVLGRAVAVAAPAGLIIWLMANVSIGGISLLRHSAGFLDPFARLMGLDGVILMAFILGFPANEIVIPIVIMAYMSGGTLVQMDSLVKMRELFLVNGWDWVTAVTLIIFSISHWPCSTTLMTIKKETKSMKWTIISFLVPTVIGIVMCMGFNFIVRLFL